MSDLQQEPWSDIRHVRFLEFDFLEIGPEICGFLEGILSRQG